MFYSLSLILYYDAPEHYKSLPVLVVRVVTFYSDDPSSITAAEVYNFSVKLYFKITKTDKERLGLTLPA